MRTIIGTMTGTSMDGVDAVAVKVDGFGLSMIPTFIDMSSSKLGETKLMLKQLVEVGGSEDEFDVAATLVGEITTKTISKLNVKNIDLIALHGQTVFHQPPKSIQLINEEPILEKFKCPVLSDPRKSDLLLGGQGAPITPLSDWIMFRSEEISTAVVNLGGFCNVTLLPANCQPTQISGFDVCCCNLILNKIANKKLNQEFDVNGKAATEGTVHQNTLELILQKLNQQKNENQSLGSGDDLGDFVLSLGTDISTEDLLATTTKAIGICINESTKCFDRVLLAGGGVRNQSLKEAIVHTGTTEVLGAPIQAREAMAMAILGGLAQDGVSITLPQVTGRKETNELVGWTQVRS
ncbi:MAG: anhydro-N-acetylmuramic acid kinase [Phycisphaerales bacterium]|jgi:anhydro-N-acetylmuramic acid kinase|nr:anhydro-N-acetylmuramic acid kinase [Phycisphaerales bacterium]